MKHASTWSFVLLLAAASFLACRRHDWKTVRQLGFSCVGLVGLTYRSVCTGIAGCRVAWADLGIKALSFAEVNPFCSAVLAYHHGDVPNLGDFTQVDYSKHEQADILIAGTPCQSFSTAGHRKGLADARGNLALEFLKIAGQTRPRWLVWENVAGLLSSNQGRDFGAFLGTLAELRYGWAYRVCDAQFFGVPQQRRRVFVVGYPGDWRPAAAVLFDAGCCASHSQASLPSRTPASRRSAQSLAAGRIGETLAIAGTEGKRRGCLSAGVRNGPMYALTKTDHHCVSYPVQAFTPRAILNGRRPKQEVSLTLLSQSSCGSQSLHVLAGTVVRRITPRECERLQGFPDDYTLIPYRGRAAEDCPDGPRYEALGNSWAVPAVRWIGERILAVESVLREMP